MHFIVDKTACIGCGLCVKDCPANILTLEVGKAHLAPERLERCFKCQHCLAICPAGAISIDGVNPKKCLPITENLPSADQLELLIKGRRSIRQYSKENVPSEVLQRLLDVAWHAPTGVNNRQVLFTVIDDGAVMESFRNEVMAALSKIVKEGNLPQEMGLFAEIVRLWEESGVDTVFRGAPHLLIASAPKDAPCHEQDCLIALTTFELFAQTLKVGTCWDGIAKWAITGLIPEFQARLGIPEAHQFGYSLVFGKPAVTYKRAAKRVPALINRVTASFAQSGTNPPDSKISY
ncbi:MAG: nitroreductase family protein [Candidatus Riflebacteria bacterium]|nr:nitroreductase family protein [Candidatus Riflebacteria bacterium]